MTHQFPPGMQTWLWLAFFASFAVKVPMWPVHTWLPDAHVEAPTAGSVILAGVLLKMGGYGFLRFSLPMLPEASADFAPLIFALSVVAIIYTSLVALAQEDMKKLIAYSSVAHMGFVTIGIFTLNSRASQGAIFQMLSHGVVSGALFLCVGVVYDRMHTPRDRALWRPGRQHAGLRRRLHAVHAGLGRPARHQRLRRRVPGHRRRCSRSTPGSPSSPRTGMILGAAYMLWLYRRVIFGKLTRDDLKAILDLSPREIAVFAPLILLVLWMGIYPSASSVIGADRRPAGRQLPGGGRTRAAGRSSRRRGGDRRSTTGDHRARSGGTGGGAVHDRLDLTPPCRRSSSPSPAWRCCCSAPSAATARRG